MSLFTKIFGTASQRELKSIYPIADKVDALEEAIIGAGIWRNEATTTAAYDAAAAVARANLRNGLGDRRCRQLQGRDPCPVGGPGR